MTAPSHPQGPAPLILIVDDVEDTRLIYASFLEYCGFSTATAHSAKKALEVAMNEQPSVIVMDYSMPDVDGLGAARLLAAEPVTAHIPVIIITGHIDLVRPSTVKAAGACSLILKPCLPDVLEAEVRRVLGGDRDFRVVRGTPRGLA